MPYEDPQRLIEEFPEQGFEEYSPEALQAALDAFNGAIYQGAEKGEALKMAHSEASKIDETEARGRSSETLPRRGPRGPAAGGGRTAPRGPVR